MLAAAKTAEPEIESAPGFRASGFRVDGIRVQGLGFGFMAWKAFRTEGSGGGGGG